MRKSKDTYHDLHDFLQPTRGIRRIQLLPFDRTRTAKETVQSVDVTRTVRLQVLWQREFCRSRIDGTILELLVQSQSHLDESTRHAVVELLPAAVEVHRPALSVPRGIIERGLRLVRMCLSTQDELCR